MSRANGVSVDLDGDDTPPEFLRVPGTILYCVAPNWDLTTVEVTALREWLEARDQRAGFFFGDKAKPAADYLNPDNIRYAPKLAAAVSAWLALEGIQLPRSPKQSLDKWLREHAAQFGMTDEEGKVIEQAVQDCAKVANWNLGGGAPRTPVAQGAGFHSRPKTQALSSCRVGRFVGRGGYVTSACGQVSPRGRRHVFRTCPPIRRGRHDHNWESLR